MSDRCLNIAPARPSRSNGGAVGDVDVMGGDVVAGVGERVDGCLQVVGVVIGEQDVASGAYAAGDSLADSAGADDDDDFGGSVCGHGDSVRVLASGRARSACCWVGVDGGQWAALSAGGLVGVRDGCGRWGGPAGEQAECFGGGRGGFGGVDEDHLAGVVG